MRHFRQSWERARLGAMRLLRGWRSWKNRWHRIDRFHAQGQVANSLSAPAVSALLLIAAHLPQQGAPLVHETAIKEAKSDRRDLPVLR